MNLLAGKQVLRTAAFDVTRAIRRLLPPRRVHAFGVTEGSIGRILVLNLDRQPRRWRLMRAELDRLRDAEGRPLTALASRLSAVDARDGRQTAPTPDVDPIYRMEDQLFVQPDRRLEECFGADERIRMTRQEVAVARSHIEAWKAIAEGPDGHVLVLEDDACFALGAVSAIDRSWRTAWRGRPAGPQLLYLSYLDAGGTAERAEVTADLFRPVRGLWALSGYVLSKAGAAVLLRAMPVTGPVDLWMNRRFAELDVLALAKPAILQRPGGGSDNAYSILPYLARSGGVDAGSAPAPRCAMDGGPVLAWNPGGPTDTIGMALSMLGRRVRSCRREAWPAVQACLAGDDGGAFDAYVDACLDGDALAAIVSERPAARFVAFQAPPGGGTTDCPNIRSLPPERTLILPQPGDAGPRWEPLCAFLGLAVPDCEFPAGPSHEVGLFELGAWHTADPGGSNAPLAQDPSPWVLPHAADRPSGRRPPAATAFAGDAVALVGPGAPAGGCRTLTETFPGNMAAFDHGGLREESCGTTLVLSKSPGGLRPFRSGAFASTGRFGYGLFEAELKAARGSGLITGFFLHRDSPRQEIDVELPGRDTRRMLVNVYFNPGDEGAAMGYGYRGTPRMIELGFDAAAGFHSYAIEWTPDGIRWIVDGRPVHERGRWEPTPIPHLPMRLYANLWSPRSKELAGPIREPELPAESTFRSVTVRSAARCLQQACGDAPSPAVAGRRAAWPGTRLCSDGGTGPGWPRRAGG